MSSNFWTGPVVSPALGTAWPRWPTGFVSRLAADGTGYADLIINPTHWAAWQGRTRELIEALDAGFTAAAQDGLPPVGLCISLLRTQSADEAVELVENLVAWRHPRVVALVGRWQ